MVAVLDSSDIAVRLADEGVPLRAIARAVRMPSSDLREQLHEALSDGRLLELPCDDWPPGCPKDQRALQISRTVRENREALVAMQLFSLPPSGARVLVKLLETERTSREVLHVALSRTSDPVSEIKIVDVAICSMRKRLKKFGIEIVTLWAYGFQLSTAHRRRALDLLPRHAAAPPADFRALPASLARAGPVRGLLAFAPPGILQRLRAHPDVFGGVGDRGMAHQL
jgi:two-component system, cell cycle response regulator CtrA